MMVEPDSRRHTAERRWLW